MSAQSYSQIPILNFIMSAINSLRKRFTCFRGEEPVMFEHGLNIEQVRKLVRQARMEADHSTVTIAGITADIFERE